MIAMRRSRSWAFRRTTVLGPRSVPQSAAIRSTALLSTAARKAWMAVSGAAGAGSTTGELPPAWQADSEASATMARKRFEEATMGEANPPPGGEQA